jgi:UDP-N-acetyl-2-amino-2-deoxyglucuronate dehydrogenase
MKFDRDPKRTGVWTHFRAYEHLNELYDLAAVCDPDEESLRCAVERKPGLMTYTDLDELLENETLDVVSLCTPPELHIGQIMKCREHVKGILLEKPLGGTAEEAAGAVEACEQSGTLLLVNYYKRFDGAVPQFRRLMEAGRIGQVRHVTGYYSGPVEAVGSHLIDLCLYLFGPMKLEHRTGADTAASAVFRLERGGTLGLMSTGCREDLVFEVDAIGSEGRLRLMDNCARVESWTFQTSRRYDNYRELNLEPCEGGAVAERFLPLFEEMHEGLLGSRTVFTSDGRSALVSQRLLMEMMTA